MDIFGLKNTFIASVISAAVFSCITWYAVASYKDTQHDLVISNLRDSAQQALITETNKVLDLQQKLSVLQSERVKERDELQQKIVESNKKYLAAVRAGDLRLRDPGSSTSNNHASGSDSTNNPQESRTELSREAAEFLLELTAEANRVAVDLNSCIDENADIRRTFESLYKPQQ